MQQHTVILSTGACGFVGEGKGRESKDRGDTRHGGGNVVADEAGRHKLDLEVDDFRAKRSALYIHADGLLRRVLWVCPVCRGYLKEAHIFTVPANTPHSDYTSFQHEMSMSSFLKH